MKHCIICKFLYYSCKVKVMLKSTVSLQLGTTHMLGGFVKNIKAESSNSVED